MKNLNYKEMSTNELKAYILKHRDDNQAFDEYRSRLKPVGSSYSFLNKTPEERKKLEEAISQKLQETEK